MSMEQSMSEKIKALSSQISAAQANAADAGPDPSGDAALAAERPNCLGCGDWDDTVTTVEITPRSTALLCAACAASPEILTGLAAEDGLDEVDE